MKQCAETMQPFGFVRSGHSGHNRGIDWGKVARADVRRQMYLVNPTRYTIKYRYFSFMRERPVRLKFGVIDGRYPSSS